MVILHQGKAGNLGTAGIHRMGAAGREAATRWQGAGLGHDTLDHFKAGAAHRL